MRALTLTPEWAWAVCRLGKRVENRTWAPPASAIGTTIALHAGSKRPDWPAVELMARLSGWSVVRPWGDFQAADGFRMDRPNREAWDRFKGSIVATFTLSARHPFVAPPHARAPGRLVGRAGLSAPLARPARLHPRPDHAGHHPRTDARGGHRGRRALRGRLASGGLLMSAFIARHNDALAFALLSVAGVATMYCWLLWPASGAR